MTLKDLIVQAAEQHGSSVALRYKQQGKWLTISYDELLTRIRHASEIVSRRGIQAGDRVAIYLENCPKWVEIYFAVVGLGAIAVPIDAKLKESEVAHILHDSGTRLLFADSMRYPIRKRWRHTPRSTMRYSPIRSSIRSSDRK